MRYLMMSKTTDSAPDEQLYPGVGTRVVAKGAEITVTDGPFAEAKESVAGFALIEVATKEEAIEMARRFLGIVGDGESVVQEVFGP